MPPLPHCLIHFAKRLGEDQMKKIAVWMGALLLAGAAGHAMAQLTSAELRAAQARTAAAAERARANSDGSSGMRYYGPADAQPRYQPPPASIGEAPAQLKYMSPRCSALNDALRTASARGLDSTTINTMRKDYGRECSEDEGEARSRLSEEMRDKSKQKREAQMTEAQLRDRAALRQEQCGESKRILVTKRARTDLNDGEKAELKRFEENFRSRCG